MTLRGLLPASLENLPPPSSAATAHSAKLHAFITREITAGDGWLSFARFMELALHAPGLGYYSAGATKFGDTGDFVTAPGIGSLFGRTLARQAAQILQTGIPVIVEIGAGNGRLACDLLKALDTLERLPERYLILETSADLRERQRELLQREVPVFAERVAWLDALPQSMTALVLANEVLDAMPVHIVEANANTILERGVTVNGDAFAWRARPVEGAVLDAA